MSKLNSDTSPACETSRLPAARVAHDRPADAGQESVIQTQHNVNAADALLGSQNHLDPACTGRDGIRLVGADEFMSADFAQRWRALLREVSSPHDLGQTYAWNRTWWQSYEKHGAGVKQLFVLAEEGEGQLLRAVWPFFMRQRFGLRAIHWLGQVEGMITDYMVPIVPDEHRPAAVKALLGFLANNSDLWDVVNLTIPTWSGWFSHFAKALAIHGSRAALKWEADISDSSTAVDLPPSFEALLSSLGADTRKNLRRYLRAVEREGAEFTICEGDDIVPGLPDLFRLNSLRWRVFSDEESRTFLRGVVGRATTDGDLPLLVSLGLRGETLATALCYQSKGICFYHSAGVVRRTVAGFSPGIAMIALLMRYLIGRGARRLDFSPGLEEYKLRLGGTVEPLISVMFWRHESCIRKWRALNFINRSKLLVMRQLTAKLPGPAVEGA
jgi:CelD/BcsL family acetyltransferase involved in cellulose biosynthesis